MCSILGTAGCPTLARSCAGSGEKWAFPGAGWSCTRYAAMMTEPEFQPIIGFAQPWTLGTNGAVTGQAVMAVISNADDMAQWKGKLKGKFVLAAVPHPSEMVTTPYMHRLTDAELAAAEESPDPISGNPPVSPLGFPARNPVGGGAGARGGRGAAAGAHASGRDTLRNGAIGEPGIKYSGTINDLSLLAGGSFQRAP